MQFGRGGGGAAGNKQNVVVLAVLGVVIAAAGFMVYRTMFPPATSGTTDGMMPGMMVGPPDKGATPGGPAGPGGPPPGTQPGAPAPGAPPEGAPAQGPGAAAPNPSPAPAPSPAAPPPSAQPAAQGEMKQIKVFGTVNVSYPTKWKISAGGGNMAAVFTDGKASFEVHPPDPKAETAKAIALSALKSVAKGAAVTAQGSTNIAGHDAYWVATKVGGQTARIVGVDAPTRVVLFEHVKGSGFDSYRKVFDQMQQGMSF